MFRFVDPSDFGFDMHPGYSMSPCGPLACGAQARPAMYAPYTRCQRPSRTVVTRTRVEVSPPPFGRIRIAQHPGLVEVAIDLQGVPKNNIK